MNAFPVPDAAHEACRAITELPDEHAVERAGISLDLEMARIVLCLVSRHIGMGRSKSRMAIYNTNVALAFMARQTVDRNGETSPAPFPDLPTNGWPQGPEVFRKLGITSRDLETFWRFTRARADDAVLPLHWALGFCPAEVWPMIAQMVSWGPERTFVQLEWAVHEMARTTTQRTRRRRPAGSPLSLATIENRLYGVGQLANVIVELRSIALTSPVISSEPLEAWTMPLGRIDARDFGARDANQDNSGPTVQEVSTQLKLLAEEARATPPAKRYLKLRRVLLLALLAIYGTRIDALRNTHVEDFIPDFRFSDGTVGPALVIIPEKSWGPDERFHLPLPVPLAAWISEWITLTGRHIGQPDEPLFPARKPQPGTPSKPLTTHGLYTAIAGARQGASTGSWPLLAMGDDPYIGWRPHAYRHTALQLAETAAAHLQRDDPTFYPHVHPETFGAAVVGHGLIRTVGAIYRDLDREVLARSVVDHMWTLLYGDGVRRKGPDPERIRNARHHVEFLSTTARALEDAARSHEAKADQFTRKASTAQKEPRRLEFQFSAANERLAAHAKRDELRRLDNDILAAQHELETATTTLAPIPDGITDHDHACLVNAALGAVSADLAVLSGGTALADELTVSDIAHLFGVATKTVRTWIREGTPLRRPRLWDEDAWIRYTEKDRRLPVERLNHDNLTDAQLHRLGWLQEQRARANATRNRA